jgi:hypothetical protein
MDGHLLELPYRECVCQKDYVHLSKIDPLPQPTQPKPTPAVLAGDHEEDKGHKGDSKTRVFQTLTCASSSMPLTPGGDSNS